MKLGLALSSGAARGYAFIPIIEKLWELGVKFDMISGCSIGGAAAAYLGTHDNFDDIKMILHEAEPKDYLLKTVEIGSIKNSIFTLKRVKKHADKLFKNKKFKDCKMPIYIVATSLEKLKPKYFSKGNLIDPTLATITVPGVFPPVKIGNEHYVDGAIVEPMPVDILFEKGCDRVIAIDLTGTKNWEIKLDTLSVMSQAYAKLMENQIKEYPKEKVFVFKPKFKAGLWEASKFHKWADFHLAGKNCVKRNINSFKKWI